MNKIVIDCFGQACPMPLIKTRNEIKKMQAGDILIVHIDHVCAMSNVPEWAKNMGHKVKVEELSNGEWAIIIEKK